ncbi:hypothetical protein IEI94_02095 [Halomonas sp. ML-15]|uniref:hypothetical protein n=1 Tax=Halomonas sp. ML-15 TaxID=2773305 RepID=UPI001745E259|nr:hypothetical protein [Halomonas sp. ML-15]MBD3894646.1 hypothetical protein [Halomonas sp. ML-15]
MPDQRTILSFPRNARQMISVLTDVVSNESVDLLEKELERHVIALCELANDHILLASSVSAARWRQKVSRSYYCAYNTRRAVELYVSGVYNIDSSDHKNVHKLPDDFPEKETRVARLRDLREDRNSADYDHTVVEGSLLISSSESVSFAKDFLDDAKVYLEARGVFFEGEG